MPFAFELAERAADVGHRVADVVEARAALRDVLADGALGVGALEQLDPQAPAVVGGDADPLGGDLLLEEQRQAEGLPVEGLALLEALHRDAEVIHGAHQGPPQGLDRDVHGPKGTHPARTPPSGAGGRPGAVRGGHANGYRTGLRSVSRAGPPSVRRRGSAPWRTHDRGRSRTIDRVRPRGRAGRRQASANASAASASAHWVIQTRPSGKRSTTSSRSVLHLRRGGLQRQAALAEQRLLQAERADARGAGEAPVRRSARARGKSTLGAVSSRGKSSWRVW